MRTRHPLWWNRWVTPAAAAVAIAATFLPWVTVRGAYIGQVDVAGAEFADGWLAIAAAVFLAAFAVLSRAADEQRGRVAATTAALVASAAIAAIAVHAVIDVNAAAAHDNDLLITVGSGLWATLAAGAVGMAAQAIRLIEINAARRSDPNTDMTVSEVDECSPVT